jgi:hypothetical protein
MASYVKTNHIVWSVNEAAPVLPFTADAGSGRFLVVVLTYDKDRGSGEITVTSATYDGVAMSSVGTITNDDERIVVYKVSDPATSSKNVAVTFSANTNEGSLQAHQFNDAEDATKFATGVGADDTPTASIGSPLAAVSVGFGGGMVAGGDTNPFTPGGSNTERLDDITDTAAGSDHGIFANTFTGVTLTSTAAVSDTWSAFALEVTDKPLTIELQPAISTTIASPLTVSKTLTLGVASVSVDTKFLTVTLIIQVSLSPAIVVTTTQPLVVGVSQVAKIGVAEVITRTRALNVNKIRTAAPGGTISSTTAPSDTIVTFGISEVTSLPGPSKVS